ncbi:MAG: hypothetical protein AAF628_06975 [Planctomycetota bacterium]
MTETTSRPAAAVADAEAPRGVLLAVTLISVATLAVQVLQTRLFSVMLWHHLTYMVVTITLLGFAAGGSLLAIWPGLSRPHGDPRVAVSTCCSLFGLTLLGAFAVLSNSPLDTLDIEADRTKYFWLFARYAYLVVPFAFAGLAIAIPLKEYGASVHRTYFWNLIGSGAGSFAFLLLVRTLGGPGCLFLFTALGGVAGFFALAGRRGASAWPTGLLALASTATILLAFLPDVGARLVSIDPARSKAQSVFEPLFDVIEGQRRAANPDLPDRDYGLAKTKWTPTCRLDTVPVPYDTASMEKDLADPAGAPRGQVHVFQDGDAPTVIWSGTHAAELAFERHFYGLGYRLVDQPRVLIIGPGGGNDVETALHYGAESVTAVDINGDTLALIQSEPFKSFTNDVYNRPGVAAVHSEGRSFLRRAGRTFDLIQMSGTDTYAALTSGSYIFSESYLYTEEAFDDYFAHLSERGVLCVIRFRFEPARETLKLVATAATALGKRGIADPSQHFLVINQEDAQAKIVTEHLQNDAKLKEKLQFNPKLKEQLSDFATDFREPLRYAFTIARRTPFTADEVAQIETALTPMNGPTVTHNLYYGAGQRAEDKATEYGQLLAAFVAGDEAKESFYDDYQYHIVPAADDKPFFFHFYTFDDVQLFGSSSDAGYEGLTGSEPIGLYILAALVLQTGVATFLLVLVPLLFLRRSAPAGVSRMRALLFFMALGLAYLLVEITTIQRFVLYLGHPTYSLSAGLASFLVFSGLGSAFAGRLNAGRRTAASAAVAVVVLLLAHAFLLPNVLRDTLALPEAGRVGMTVLWIAPLAFAMGMPFPTGLSLLGRQAPALVPWAFGVNGAASVLASILGIVVAMEWGFTVVFLAAAALYLLASVCVPRAP